MIARLASRYMAKPTGANQIYRQEGELGNDCQVYTIRVKQAQANLQARWRVRFRAQLGNDCRAGVQVYGEACRRQSNMQARGRVRE